MNKKALAVAVSGAIAAPFAAQAIDVKLSGQVNRAIAFRDTGKGSDVAFVDSSASGSRWRLTGSEDIGSGLTAGIAMEFQWKSSSSFSHPLKSGDSQGSRFNERRVELFFSSNWGKVSLGQGPSAGDGTTEADLSDTWYSTGVSMGSYVGAVSWKTSGGGNLLPYFSTYTYFDSYGRNDRVRYDSPSWGPISLAASIGNNSQWSGQIRADTDIGGGTLSSGLFYGKSAGHSNERFGGSAAYLFSQGTNLAFSYSRLNTTGAAAGAGTRATTWYVKLGHKWGHNAISTSFGQGQDITPGYRTDGFQLGFSHTMPKPRIVLYAGWQYNTLDTPTGVAKAKDINMLVVGSRIQF